MLVILDLVLYIHIYMYRKGQRDIRVYEWFQENIITYNQTSPHSLPVPLNFYVNRKEGVELRTHTLVGLHDTLDASKRSETRCTIGI